MTRLVLDEIADETPDQRLRIALSLYDFGVAMMRENLRRRHPAANEAEITSRLHEWLRSRPGAENGDGIGCKVPWPRR